MNKFQKLSQISKDIEILEAAGKIKAAEVLHKKFIKEAQYAMPQMMTTMMPQMMMPQMMSMMPQMMPQMMPMMMARPAVVPAAVAKPVGTPAPIQRGQVTPPAPQPTPTPTPVPPPPPTNKEIKPPYTGTTPPTPNPADNNQRGYGDKQSKDQEMQYLMNEKKRLEEMGANQPSSPYFKQYQTILEMIKRNQGGSIIKSKSMNQFLKLSQINKDIELLEDAGKIKAAEVLHKKFIKEAQAIAQNRTNYGPSSVNPQQQNYVKRDQNSMTSVRDGVSTNFNFTGLDPQMELATVPGVPGSPKQVLIPKGSDPRMADPAFAASQRIKAQENAIPGYSDFLKLRPQPYQKMDFIQANGTSTDAGMAIYNELLSKSQAGGKSLGAPAVTTSPTATPAAKTPIQAVAENPYAGPIAPNPITINTMPSARNVQPTSAPMPTAPVRTNKPQVSTNSQAQPAIQDNFQNYYTEENDTANFYQQQNSNPNAQQESNEQKIYVNALNDIINGFASKDPTLISQAERLYQGTLSQFKNPNRQKAFKDQIQRQRVKYLKPQPVTNVSPNYGISPQAVTNISPNFGL